VAHEVFTWQLLDRGQRVNGAQPSAQLILPLRRHQERPECLEAFPLIRAVNVVRLAEDRIQQLALWLTARRDAFARLKIQFPEILLHLSEVREKAPREVGNLQITLLHLRGIERRSTSRTYTFDLPFDLLALAFELPHSHGRIVLRAHRKISKDLKEREQPRLRAHELLGRERLQPLDRLFRRGCEIELRIITGLWIVLPQECATRCGPIVEVVTRATGVPVGIRLA